MRPENLFPLYAPVTTLSGVGPRLGHGKRPYRVRCRDETGFLHLIFFHAKGDYLARQLPIGATRIVSGRVEHFNNEIQITHPDYILAPEEASQLRSIEPVYGLTAGLTLRMVQKAIAAALERAHRLPEWLDPALQRRHGWTDWRTALMQLHAPDSEAALAPSCPARQRLAYDELLANQLAIALVRANNKRLTGRPIAGDGRLRRPVIDALPFRLTGAQLQALAEIESDMASPTRMMRLLQGDVGSGKTVVAVLAMLNAVECSGQAALMAPTEILCRQHLATVEKLAAPVGITVTLLTGREKGRARQDIRDRLASGAAQIVIGTHALFQDDVGFRNLALAVIDEQHRFGVDQRMALSAKGDAVDILVMTATPIPRTLLLTAYGDLDASLLREKPAGRKPVATRIIALLRLDEVIAAVERALASGAKIYWICPLVEESETVDLADVEARHAQLAATFGHRVGLIHGRMKSANKDRVMADFASDGTDLLVATTVVEVGVDVPRATIMVIEHAERFGLAQLHQLRGRVGRGEAASSCLLLYAAPLGETAKARLSIMRDSDDGFLIAEEDLRLRGGGELLGTRQSGTPELRVADLAVHQDLLAVAQDDARLILARDPALKSPRGQALRTLLYLFQRDAAVRYARAG